MTGDHFASLSPEQKAQVVTEISRVDGILHKLSREEAFQEGRRAALDGKGYGECPHLFKQGLESLVASWCKGFEAGEIEQAEGAHFRTK